MVVRFPKKTLDPESVSSFAERVKVFEWLAKETDYITQKPCRSATSWLPPLWECFPFKQTRSCRRWRRVCKGVKETAVLNESVELGDVKTLKRH
ncbi:hypothetical protein Q5P01_002039 [Channa striata]|uniref:Uncharacterized protein n=1 Tax=Channa striata TaxID=64152 RepID=A0AA88NLT3_CHASR|nr:hypothetical protein Q5P01_002039 [Channa striata]